MVDNRFLTRKKELPLKDEKSQFFLRIMVSIATFLFAVSLSGVLAINAMIKNWNDSIIGSMTIQIMPISNLDKNLVKEDMDAHIANVLGFLRGVREVEEANLLKDYQLKKLISPWLGDAVNLENLPLPQLIDVKIKKGADVDFIKLSEKLAEISPLASIDNHKLWLAKLISFADGLKFLASSVLFLVLIISCGAIYYSTLTSMGLHKSIIEILHIMGAKDAYIAQQYSYRTGWVGAVGGIIGLVFAIPTIFLLSELSNTIEGGIISQARLSQGDWFAIFSLPIFSGLIAMYTAYFTVKSKLQKMM
ncbi:MAG: FtsX-like permease family protein [Alphaproteobacteria bacterium]